MFFLLCLGRSRTRLAATPILLQAMTRDIVEVCEALSMAVDRSMQRV